LVRKNRGKKQKLPSTTIIIDGDNIIKSLEEQLGLEIIDLMVFIKYIFNDLAGCLKKVKNLEKRLFGPIILVISEDVNDREGQNVFLEKIKKNSGGLIETFIIPSKTVNNGTRVSCTDLDVGVFLTLGLMSQEIQRVILFSGDGDYKRVLRWSGVRNNKDISLVCVRGSDSEKLKERFGDLGGTVFIIIKNKITIFKWGKKIFEKKGPISGLKESDKSQELPIVKNNGNGGNSGKSPENAKHRKKKSGKIRGRDKRENRRTI